MHIGDDQHMHRSFWINVFHREDTIVSVDRGRMHRVLGHAAKYAIVGGGHAAFASLNQ